VNFLLEQWAGHAPGYVAPTIFTDFGPFLSVLAGTILTASYFLTRRDLLPRPID
jgi:hypothetical protein